MRAFVLTLLFIAGGAYASGGECRGNCGGGGDGEGSSSTASAEASATSEAGVVSSVEASGGDAAGGEGGSANVSGTGSKVTNESHTYVFSSSLPQSNVDCSLYYGGGGGGDGGGGFIQWPWLNHSCWMKKLAAGETDADFQARLMCADKHYRKALAYNVPKKERLEACIEMKTASLQAYILAMGIGMVVEAPVVIAEVDEEEFEEVQQAQAQHLLVQQQQTVALERLERQLKNAIERAETRQRQDSDFYDKLKEIQEIGK